MSRLTRTQFMSKIKNCEAANHLLAGDLESTHKQLSASRSKSSQALLAMSHERDKFRRSRDAALSAAKQADAQKAKAQDALAAAERLTHTFRCKSDQQAADIAALTHKLHGSEKNHREIVAQERRLSFEAIAKADRHAKLAREQCDELQVSGHTPHLNPTNPNTCAPG